MSKYEKCASTVERYPCSYWHSLLLVCLVVAVVHEFFLWGSFTIAQRERHYVLSKSCTFKLAQDRFSDKASDESLIKLFLIDFYYFDASKDLACFKIKINYTEINCFFIDTNESQYNTIKAGAVNVSSPNISSNENV